jgi:hypothetical protein
MDDCSLGRSNVSLLESHEFNDRVIFIITGRSRSRQPFVKVAVAENEILFSGVDWIATYIRLTPLDDLTATLIEVSIARDMN